MAYKMFCTTLQNNVVLQPVISKCMFSKAADKVYREIVLMDRLSKKGRIEIEYVHCTRKYIENNTWVRRNTRSISSVERDIMRYHEREISCLTREINLVFPSTHVLFCLLYKLQSFLAI